LNSFQNLGGANYDPLKPGDFPIGSVSSRAAARARLSLAQWKQIPPAFISFVQPSAEEQPNGLPGCVACDAVRIIARSRAGELVFERAENETLAQFQERASASVPRDGQFWLLLPEPIPVAASMPIPVPSPNVSMIALAISFAGLFTTGLRYKIFFGGRGGGKSWAFARALVLLALLKKIRVGCFRELQNSIKESVHQVLREQIELLGYSKYFEVTEKAIRCPSTGSDFLFKGLRSNAAEIKSTEGIDVGWVEEAQFVSKDSWQILTPTIRAEGSEIWVAFNPVDEEDPTYQRFVVGDAPPEMVRQEVGWQNNPFFNSTLNNDRLAMQRNDPDAYEHVWNGGCRIMSDAVIFRGKYIVETFPPPPKLQRLYFGADFGFANDPATLVRMWTTGEAPNEELWIEYAIYGLHVEIDAMSNFYDRVPESRVWPIKADSSRPEVISYVRRQGFNISAAEKWDGCVEDGIAHLRGFKQIHIHARNVELLREAAAYRYKIDRVTNDVLPIIVDAHNHGWDAIRYGLDGFIRARGGHGAWLGL